MINKYDNKYDHTRDNLQLIHVQRNAEKSDLDRDKEYRKILKELGIEKSEDESLTKQDLGKIFVYMQEEEIYDC